MPVEVHEDVEDLVKHRGSPSASKGGSLAGLD
jgi:hypothetical protein